MSDLIERLEVAAQWDDSPSSLIHEAIARIAALEAQLAALSPAPEAQHEPVTDALELSGNTGELIDKMAEAIRCDGGHYDETPWDILSEERKEGWRGDARRALAVVKEYLTARLPASRTVTEEMVEALKRIRDTAMEHTLTARIPECGVFGGIAQDADWLLSEVARHSTPCPPCNSDYVILSRSEVEAKDKGIAALREALVQIDALDPEGHAAGFSVDALRGLVERMGAIARAALAQGADDERS